MSAIPVALQLYTVRDVAKNDFAGTVRKVAALGYAGIETDWPFAIPVDELKALTAELGLQVVGVHAALPQLQNNLAAALAESKAAGNHFITCPYMPEEYRRDLKGWQEMATFLNHAGEEVRKAGLEFCYHNHAFEFEMFDGKPAIEHLYALTDPANLQAELDVYWVKYGGGDPVEYIRRYSGRVPLVHLKDMDPTDRSFAEVGYGTLDMPGVLAASIAAGARWFIVEQDVCKRPSLESAAMSLDYLRTQELG